MRIKFGTLIYLSLNGDKMKVPSSYTEMTALMKNIMQWIIVAALMAFPGCNGTNDGSASVEGITLNRPAITLVEGSQYTLSAIVTPSDAGNKDIEWSTSAPEVATVDKATGKITAVSEGEAVVTATAADGGKTASCKVVVTPTLNILFIGNSFTEDAVQHLPGIVAAAGLGKVRMVHMNFGGRTIAEHASGYFTADDYKCYRSDPGTSAWTRDNGKYTVQDIVEENEWNVVSIQEHTGRPVAWNWTADNQHQIEQWLANMNGDQSGMPQFVYIMSQAYGDPDIVTYGQSGWLTDNFASQAAMFEAIASRGRKVQRDTAVDTVIPTGTTLQNLRSSSLNTPYDLTRDGYHMDLGLARYAAACTVFESVVAPAFAGASLDGNSFRFSTSSTQDTKYSTPVTDANAPVAVKAARNAVARPFEASPME